MNPNNIINDLPVSAAAVAADGDQMDADMCDTQQVAREAGLPVTTPALAAASDAVHESDGEWNFTQGGWCHLRLRGFQIRGPGEV